MTATAPRLLLLLVPLVAVAFLFPQAHAQLPMCVVYETDEQGVKRVGVPEDYADDMRAVIATMDARVAAACMPPPPDRGVKPADVYCKFRTNVSNAMWTGQIIWRPADWRDPVHQQTGGRETIERPGQEPVTRDLRAGLPPTDDHHRISWCEMECRGESNATLGTAEFLDMEFTNRGTWFIPPADDPDAEQEYCEAAQSELIARQADCQLSEAASSWQVQETINPGWRPTDETGQGTFDSTDSCGVRRHGYYTWRAWARRSDEELRQECIALFNRRYPTDADKNEACREQGNSRGITVRWLVGTGVCGDPPMDTCSDEN